jgi:hypothetical protein
MFLPKAQMKYLLAVTVPPEVEPVTLDEAKNHLRLDLDFTDEDDDITAMITVARKEAEDHTSRCLIAQTLIMYLDGFPAGTRPWHSGHHVYPGSISLEAYLIHGARRTGVIQIPKAPLTSVDFIKYVDTTGTQQTLDPSLYQVDPQADDELVRILPAYGQVWPATRVQPNAVSVQFKAGFEDAAHVPARFKLAMKQMLASWYENREGIVLGTQNTPFVIPNSAKLLLMNDRLNF